MARLPLLAPLGLALATLGSAPVAAGQHAHAHAPSTMGVHGMVLFGGADGLFASHLPLFRAPHDRQLVLEIALDDPALDRALRRCLQAAPELWTIAPERFELARLYADAADPLPGFRADLVRGHFERDGAVAHRAVRVRVVRVLHDRALDGIARSPARVTYLPVGRGRTRFLVKQVDARPDFDHVVALAPGASAPHGPVSVERRGVDAPSPARLAEAAGSRVRGTVYYDTADLR